MVLVGTGTALAAIRRERNCMEPLPLLWPSYVREVSIGLLDLRRQVSRHLGTGILDRCRFSLRPGTRL